MRNFARSVFLFASFAIGSTTSLVADQPATDPVAAYTNANGVMPGLKQLLPTFDFQGGSVTEFVDALRIAARPRELNIIVLDPMSDTKIAPVKLRNISVESALKLLRGPLTSSPIDVTWIVPENFLDNPVVYVKRPNTVASELAERAVQDQRRSTAVLSLQLGRPSSQDELNKVNTWASIALDAIEQALSANPRPGRPNPMIRFHASSGLLFVVGEPSDIAIAREVVDRFSQYVRDARATDETQKEIDRLRREIKQLQSRETNTKAEAEKQVSLVIEMSSGSQLAARQAIESVLLRELAKGEAGLEIENDEKGLVISGPQTLVNRAALVARGAKVAMARTPEHLLQRENAPSDAK